MILTGRDEYHYNSIIIEMWLSKTSGDSGGGRAVYSYSTTEIVVGMVPCLGHCPIVPARKKHERARANTARVAYAAADFPAAVGALPSVRQ